MKHHTNMTNAELHEAIAGGAVADAAKAGFISEAEAIEYTLEVNRRSMSDSALDESIAAWSRSIAQKTGHSPEDVIALAGEGELDVDGAATLGGLLHERVLRQRGLTVR